MSNIVDQYRDPTFATLITLIQDRPAIEELVKEADVNEQDLNTLPNSAFAWEAERALPIHDRSHTIMSRVYREKLSHVPPEVDVALQQACDVYQIPDSLFERTKQAAAVDNEDDYLLPDIKRLRVTSAESVKTASEQLLTEYTKLSVEHRAMACRRLLDKAMVFNVKISPHMSKLAGFTVSSTATLRSWLSARGEATNEDFYKNAFNKLATELKSQPDEIHDRELLLKLADTIHELDKQAGLEKLYDRKLPDPLQTVFNTTKIAENGVDLNGRHVSLSKLGQYDASFYEDILGPDITKEANDGGGAIDVQKLATIIETLPTDMKMLLSRHIR